MVYTATSSRMLKRKIVNNERSESRIFFRRGCTRLLLYFNTNKPHRFFLQNTSCIRKPQVISGGGRVRTPCTLPLDPPLNDVTMNPPIEALQLLLMASPCVKPTLRYRSQSIVTRHLKHKVLQWSKLQVVHHLPQGLHIEWNTRARVKFSLARRVTRVSASSRVAIFTLFRALPLLHYHWETKGTIRSLKSSLSANLLT